jgi:hypothetical protein
MFCWLGWHWWEEPFEVEKPSISAPIFFIFTFYSQYATRRCKCCDKVQRVHRTGSNEKWKPVNDNKVG